MRLSSVDSVPALRKVSLDCAFREPLVDLSLCPLRLALRKLFVVACVNGVSLWQRFLRGSSQRDLFRRSRSLC